MYTYPYINTYIHTYKQTGQLLPGAMVTVKVLGDAQRQLQLPCYRRLKDIPDHQVSDVFVYVSHPDPKP